MSDTDKSSSDSNSSSSDNESLPDITKLKPYDFEPVRSPGESNVSSSESEEDSSDGSETLEQERIGNVDWCECGRCKPMLTYTESLCCKDTNEIPVELFEGA